MKIIPHATREIWLSIRQRHIGGSEVAALFGCQPAYALSHWALWQVKAGRADAPPVTHERAAWGLRLEAAIAEAAAEKEGWQIRRPAGYVESDRVPGIGCTLDFIIDADPAEGGPGVLEVKNSDWLAHRRDWTDDEPPMHILLQLQHQLAATGMGWGAIACLVGGNELRVYRYRARPKLIAQIEARVAAFWQSIAAGKEPPVDGSEGAAEILRQLYPSDDGVDEPVDMTGDNELPELCDRYREAVAVRRQAEKRETEAKNGIMAKLGEHRAAACQGYLIRAPQTPDSPGTRITAAMVGTYMGGRRGYRKLTIKEDINGNRSRDRSTVLAAG